MTTNIAELPTQQKSPGLALETKEKPKISRDEITKIVREIQQAANKDMTKLPSRDIPKDTLPHIQDEKIRPNYVPTPTSKDYIEDHNTEEYLLQQNIRKSNSDIIDNIYNELHISIIVMVLYFFFQMPFITNNMRIYLPSLYNSNANPNIWGYLFQTLIFGILFYGFQKLTKYLTKLDTLLRSNNE